MKLPIICSQCMIEDISSSDIIANVEFRDDGRYEVECHKGHKSITILQQQKFEVLFEIGAYAIVDGYYREAVSSFTSSLERFYEFFIQAVLLEKKVAQKDFKQTWKHVSRQSERQLGAFLFLYLMEFDQPPKLLSTANVNFRNEVIHKGKIPTRQESLDYGQTVLDLIYPILEETKSRYSKGVEQTVFHHLKECRKSEDDKRQVSTLSKSTIVSLSTSRLDCSERALENAVSNLKKRR